MNDGFQKEVLKQIAEKLLLKKVEITLSLQGRVDNPSQVASEIISNLLKEGLIAVAPVGDGTYAVTQRGMREAAKV